MTKLEKLNQWLILVANLGVLAGVILLAVEIRQNQAIMRRDQDIQILDSAHLDVSRFTEWRGKFINDKEVAQLWLDGMAGKELDEADQLRFIALCNDAIWAGALMHERSVDLGRTEYETATIQWMREGLESAEGLQTCWSELRDVYIQWGYDDFVAAVEENRG